MPTIDTKGLPEMLADQAVAAQASAGRALDYSDGSILRAMAEGFAAVALWFQAMLLRVLAATRLTTSDGADVDSFLADYGVARIPATAAQGTVTLSRTAPSLAAFVPVGTLLRTADGAVTFGVVADAADANYDIGAGGYTIPAMVTAIDVPAAAVVAGTSGNVAPGTVTLLASALAGVDSVANAAPFSGGADAETDEAARARFPAYLASLSKATRPAIEYAVSQVQPGIRWSIIPNEDAGGAPRKAHFLVVVDDGAGASPPSLLNRTYAAVDAVRGLGITFEVIGATPLAADTSLTIATDSATNHAVAVGAASAAIRAFQRGLSIGQPLRITRLPDIAYGAAPGVTNVSAVTINGGTSDLIPSARQVVVPGIIAVS